MSQVTHLVSRLQVTFIMLQITHIVIMLHVKLIMLHVTFIKLQVALIMRHVTFIMLQVTHLVISRPEGFHYHPGDYIFINIPEITYTEWHPFTISSAPEMTGTCLNHVHYVRYEPKSRTVRQVRALIRYIMSVTCPNQVL